MPFSKIWIHLVWSTKNREPLLTDNIRRKVFNHIRENADKKKIEIDSINGYTDHVHLLLVLQPTQSIAEITHWIKGESSHWINKNKICSGAFEWQDDYFAVSVSEKNVPKLQAYINNQEKHHHSKTFEEEYDKLKRQHNKQISETALPFTPG
ncbi:MAG: IS200/IS605 family transposase [Chitinophagaceae bacterium]|nr:IS200/IS605 family transposase [Chitinophagaceae bacterium]